MRTGADAGSAELGGKYMKKSISVVTLFPGADKGTVWRSGGGLFLQYK